MIKHNTFTIKADKKYNYKFDYSKFTYVNAKVKSTIICPIHGEFQQNPDKHLSGKYGCLKCSNLQRKITLSKLPKQKRKVRSDWVVEKAYLDQKYPQLSFRLINNTYNGTSKPIHVVCKQHGIFEVNIHNIKRSTSHGCPNCGKLSNSAKTFHEVVTQANILYKNKYQYFELKPYTSRKTKIEIICPIHGKFTKSMDKHLSGSECYECTITKLIKENKLPGGYCETIFKRNDELRNKMGILYYLKIDNTYKIGITLDLQKRINDLKHKSQTPIQVIDSLSMNLYHAYQLEQLILLEFKQYRIRENYSTELFSKDILNKTNLTQIRSRLNGSS